MKQKAIDFLNLHQPGNPFILANAWNAGSAALLEEAGFAAIGTTSAGIAFSRGLPDYEAELSFSDAIEETARIVNSVDLPVSMDSENCYGDTAEEVYANVKKIAATGVCGASIEDYTGNPAEPHYDSELAVDRVRAAKNALEDLGYPFTLTARAECYLTGHDSPYAESIRRVNQYREAGADCLYVPGIKDIETIGSLVQEVNGPVNVVMGLSGKPVTVSELKQAGVARISIGGSLARATFGLIRRAAREMLDQGTFDYSNGQIADSELCQLFSKKKS